MQYKIHSEAREMIDRLSDFFVAKEFECPCCNRSLMDDELIIAIENLRYVVKFPLIITSGFRCDIHNIKIGGAPKSLHRFGLAVDIKISHLSSEQLITLIRASQTNFSELNIRRFNGLGLGDNKLHLDIRTDPAAWTY